MKPDLVEESALLPPFLSSSTPLSPFSIGIHFSNGLLPGTFSSLLLVLPTNHYPTITPNGPYLFSWVHQCYDWMFMATPQFYVKILMTRVVVLDGRAFGRRLGYEAGPLMDGVSALIKETPQSSLFPSITRGCCKRSATCLRAPCDPGLLAMKTMRN